MLDALEEVAGKAVRERVRFVRDETHRRHRRQLVARLHRRARRAASACTPTRTSPTIIRQYIADCRETPAGAAALKGLSS